jgi:hypothetical protein
MDVDGQKSICISYENAEGELVGVDDPVPLETVQLLHRALVEWAERQ